MGFWRWTTEVKHYSYLIVLCVHTVNMSIGDDVDLDHLRRQGSSGFHTVRSHFSFLSIQHSGRKSLCSAYPWRGAGPGPPPRGQNIYTDHWNSSAGELCLFSPIYEFIQHLFLPSWTYRLWVIFGTSDLH